MKLKNMKIMNELFKMVILLLTIINFNACYAQNKINKIKNTKAESKIIIKNTASGTVLSFKNKNGQLDKKTINPSAIEFNMDSTMLFYSDLKLKNGINKYDVMKVGGGEEKKIHTCDRPSYLRANGDGRLIVEEFGGSIVSRILKGFDENGNMFYNDSNEIAITYSRWSIDNKYYAIITYKRIANREGTFLAFKVFNKKMEAIYEYTFDDDFYDASNFDYQNDIFILYFAERKVSKNQKIFIAKINVTNKTIERSERP